MIHHGGAVDRDGFCIALHSSPHHLVYDSGCEKEPSVPPYRVSDTARGIGCIVWFDTHGEAKAFKRTTLRAAECFDITPIGFLFSDAQIAIHHKAFGR